MKLAFDVRHTTNRILIVALFTFCVMPSSRVLAAPGFQGLGDLPGGAFNSRATYITPDGMTVLGTSDSTSGSAHFRWDAIGGIVEHELLPQGDFSSLNPAVATNNLTVIAGSGQSSLGIEAFVLSDTGDLSGLGDLPDGVFKSVPSAISYDGSVIVGKGTIGPDTYENVEAFLWTEDTGIIGLGDLPGGPDRSWATDVSADGSVVVGCGTAVTSPGEPWESAEFRAFRWTESEGMTDLGIPKGGAAKDPKISADGSVIVAHSYNDLGQTHPIRWMESTGSVLLDEPTGGEDLAEVADLSADGSMIVGFAFTDRSGGIRPEAVVWNELNEAMYLQDLLTDLGLNLTGWQLEYATGISDDGLTIVGTGINPDGNTEAFIARLPEPSSVALIAAGIAGLSSRRRS